MNFWFILFLWLGFSGIAGGLVAQNDSSSTWRFGFYADVYSAWDFPQPDHFERSPYAFNHNRQGIPQFNQWAAKMSYVKSGLSIDLSVHVGTYPTDNYAAEPLGLRWIEQAQISYAFGKDQRWSISGGLMPSTVGFESARSKENPSLSRSLVAEMSPYFLTGGLVSYKASPSLSLGMVAATGWQRIVPVESNSLAAFGAHMDLSLTNELAFHAAWLAGTEDPDSSRRWRVFQNLYLTGPLAKNQHFWMGLDVGMQQAAPQNSTWQVWGGAVAIWQMHWHPKWRSHLRGEWFLDENHVVVRASNEAFHVLGFSAGLDFLSNKQQMWRIEIRNRWSLGNDQPGLSEVWSLFFAWQIGHDFSLKN